MNDKNTFYVTTPIYYVTARPHLGSLYSTVIADVLARWYKLRGCETFMLTGTDEHGQKILQAAEKAGKDPKKFVDGFIDSYKQTWADYHIDYNYFIRTTDREHVKAVQAWLQKLIDQGDIYKDYYKGWYCTPCETYLTEKELEEQLQAGAKEPVCMSCHRNLQYVEEESYFFRLSAYQDRLLQFYKTHPNFIVPKERMHEIVSFVERGLKDLSVSRTTISWGIPFPNDTKHVAYVWADALNNYITAVGYGEPGHEAEFKKWWPAQVHVLGKDIVRFHAVYWPAFLMASGLELPEQLLVHGWIKVNDQKMSKSLGNVVDPEELRVAYGADNVRYYLMRHIAITQDSSFSTADLEQAINSELANDLGNLLNRVIALAQKNGLDRVVPPKIWSEDVLELRDNCWTMIENAQEYMDNFVIHMALGEIWKFINQLNAYVHKHEPWKLVKTDKEKFNEIISASCHGLYVVGNLLWPIMPEKMMELLNALGLDPQFNNNILHKLEEDLWVESFNLQPAHPLFKRIEITKAEESPKVMESQSYITIDDLIKVELRVGTIIEVEPIEQSDKLYKMQVDLGSLGKRQILAGVRKSFTQDYLIGKQAIFVTNLQPRKMVGLESQGMMLVAKDAEGNLQLSTVAQPVENGVRLQ